MSEKRALEKALAYLKINKMPFDKKRVQIYLEENEISREGLKKPMYIVSFFVGPIGSEYKLYFMYIDAPTCELMYIMAPHGYIEILN